MSLAEAVEAPRWALMPATRTEPALLRVAAEFDSAVVRDLSRLGHRVEEAGGGSASAFGEAGLLVKHSRDGRVAAASDPRSGGVVLGL